MSSLTFEWPELLWGLFALPVLVLLYMLSLRRRTRAAFRYASLALIKRAVLGYAWRPHVPPAIFLGAIAVLLLGLARPHSVLPLPTQKQTVLLLMDVSGSMRAEDVKPNRLVASQLAARTFVAEQPRHTRIGVVAFAGTAQLVQPPTYNREDVVAAIDRFQLQRGTAIGSAIVVGLATLFPEAGLDVEVFESASGDGLEQLRRLEPRRPSPLPSDRHASGTGAASEELRKPGAYNEAVMVLLTDGETTTGLHPLLAARMASDRGVRIYTVGVGTKVGTAIRFEGWSVHVRLDEDALRSIATMTQGEYFRADSASDLKKIYETLSARLVVESRRVELTALLAAVAFALLLVSAGLSIYWFHRVL